MLSAIALYSLLGLREAKHLDWGYRTNHLLLAVFDPSQVHYDKARTKAFYDQLLQRARRLPGVTDASIAQSIPLGFTGAQKTLMLGGRKVGLWMNTVSPGHFKQMRIQLQAGREFDLSDGESSERTVIVNERMRELWPDQIAVGRSIEVEGLNREIVGIARTVKYANWNESKRPFIYLPFSQNYTPRMTLLLEVTGAPTEITRSLRGLVRELDPAQPVSGITTFEQQINRGALYTARLALAISSAASLVVLLLSFFGVYASATAAAGRERKQTGIRKALGAPVLTLAWQAIKGVAIAASLGTLTGSILALFLASWTGKLVPGTSVAALAISALGGSAFVLLSSLMASLWPALRASSEEACSLLAVAKN